MATNLSKDFTLAEVLGVLRILTQALSSVDIQDEELKAVIHLSILYVVEALGEAVDNDYVIKVAVTPTSDAIDISTYRLDKIVKITDSTAGVCVPARTLQGLTDEAAVEQHKNKIYYCHRGENIDLAKGSAVSAYGTMYLYYKKMPVKVTATADTLDIRDKYMDIVIDKAKIKCYELLNMQPPQDLTNSTASKIQQLREANNAEMINQTNVRKNK